MSYYQTAMLHIPFAQAIERTEAALGEEGFGIVNRIDIRETLKNRIGVEFHPYVILGACNPSIAYEALKIEDKVGTMLPCNVVVQAKTDNLTEVAAIDPVASMQAIGNPRLLEAARDVQARLARVVERLSAGRAGDESTESSTRLAPKAIYDHSARRELPNP